MTHSDGRHVADSRRFWLFLSPSLIVMPLTSIESNAPQTTIREERERVSCVYNYLAVGKTLASKQQNKL